MGKNRSITTNSLICLAFSAVFAVCGIVFSSVSLVSVAVFSIFFAVECGTKKKRLFYILCAVAACATGVYAFIKSLMTIDYASYAVSLPAVFAGLFSFVLELFFFLRLEKDTSLRKNIILMMFFTLCSFASSAVTFVGFDFYIETAAACAIAATIVYMIISIFRNNQGDK